MRSILKSWHAAALAFGATLALLADAVAQAEYPAKTIRIVTINAAGSPADMSARLIGDRLSAAWKQPVVVEAIVGAGGNLAAAHVAKAPPDGYTLLMTGDAAIITNISLYKKMAYDPVRDLLPITQVALTPNILTVHNDVPATTAQELAAFARARRTASSPTVTAGCASRRTSRARCSIRWPRLTSSRCPTRPAGWH